MCIHVCGSKIWVVGELNERKIQSEEQNVMQRNLVEIDRDSTYYVENHEMENPIRRHYKHVVRIVCTF